METIVLLILIGSILLFLEFILPSLGLLTIMTVACYAYAIYTAFAIFGIFEGFLVSAICLFIALMIIALAIKVFPKLKIAKELSLKSTKTDIVDDSGEYVGKVAIALTDMSPSGKIIIDGNSYEAQSNLGFIERDSKVEVIAKDNFKLIVKKIESKENE